MDGQRRESEEGGEEERSFSLQPVVSIPHHREPPPSHRHSLSTVFARNRDDSLRARAAPTARAQTVEDARTLHTHGRGSRGASSAANRRAPPPLAVGLGARAHGVAVQHADAVVEQLHARVAERRATLSVDEVITATTSDAAAVLPDLSDGERGVAAAPVVAAVEPRRVEAAPRARGKQHAPPPRAAPEDDEDEWDP